MKKVILSLALINSLAYANNDILKNISLQNPDISELMKSANKELENFDKNNNVFNFDSTSISNANSELFGGEIKDKNNNTIRKTVGIHNSNSQVEHLRVKLFNEQDGLRIQIKNRAKTYDFSNIKAICSNKSKADYTSNYLEQYSNNNILRFAKNYKTKNIEINNQQKSILNQRCGKYTEWWYSGSRLGFRIRTDTRLKPCVENVCNEIGSSMKTIIKRQGSGFAGNYYISCYDTRTVYDTIDLDLDNNANITLSSDTNFNASGCICSSKECNDNYNIENIKNYIEDALVSAISSKITISDIKNLSNNEFSIYTTTSTANNNNYSVNKYNITSSSNNKAIKFAIEQEINNNDDYADFSKRTRDIEFNNTEEKELEINMQKMDNQEIISSANIVGDKLEYSKNSILDNVKVHIPKKVEPLKCLVSYPESNKRIIHDEKVHNQAVKNYSQDETILKTKECKLINDKPTCVLEKNETLVTDCNSNIDSVSLAKIYATNEIFKQVGSNRKNEEFSDNLRVFKADRFEVVEKQIDKCPSGSIRDIKTHSQGFPMINTFGIPSAYNGQLINIYDNLRYIEFIGAINYPLPNCLSNIVFTEAFGGLNLLVNKDTAKSIKYDKGLEINQQRVCCNIQFKKQNIEFPEVLDFKTSDESKAFCDAKSSYIKSQYGSTCADYIHNARATQRVMNAAGSGCNLTYAYDGEKVFKKDKSAHLEAIDAGSATAYRLSGLFGYLGIVAPSTGLNRCKMDLNNKQSGFVTRVADGSCKFIGHDREVIYYNSTPRTYGYNIRIRGFKIKKERLKSYISYPAYTKHTYRFCCQKSKIANIIMQEAEKQAKTNKDIGKIDYCDGLTMQQFKLLDFNKMNFDELASDFGIKASANLEKIDFEELKKKTESLKDNSHIDISNIDSFKEKK